MKNTTSLKLYSLMFVATLVAAGCATGTDKKIDEKVARETSVSTPQDLRAEAKDVIEETPGLNAEQRANLTSLRIDTQNKMQALNDQSLKLRSVLITEVFAKKNKDSEVKNIKSRLKKLEDQKLDLTFNAVDKAYTILGKQAVNNQKLMNEMVNDPRMGRLQ